MYSASHTALRSLQNYSPIYYSARKSVLVSHLSGLVCKVKLYRIFFCMHIKELLEKVNLKSIFLSLGNLGRVDYISEFEFDLFIRPDTCNPRFRVWFNFTVENVRETQVSPHLYRDLTLTCYQTSMICHY